MNDLLLTIGLGILLAVLMTGTITYLLIKYLRPATSEKSKENVENDSEKKKNQWSWVIDVRLLIAYGLFIFNLVSLAMIPWFWEILTYGWYTLVFFNLGFWTVLYLRTIKAKDKDGKDTKEADPTASKLATIIGVLLILGLATTAVYKWQHGDLTPEEYTAKVRAEKALQKALEEAPAVLHVVARCNPDAPEFKVGADGKLPAVEMYEKKGLLPWTDGPNGMSCWESMVTKDMLPIKLAILEAPTERWSQEVYNLRAHFGFVDIISTDECEALANGGGESKPCHSATWGEYRRFTQVHSTGEKPVRVEVIVRN